jgi:hypothetical protein
MTCGAFGFHPLILASHLSIDSASSLECFERLHILPLLRLDQPIEFAPHAVPKLLRECSLNFSSAQRTGQSPANAPTITATIEPIALGANGGWADAQLRCPATTRLPATFLEIPTVQTHTPPHRSYRSNAPPFLACSQQQMPQTTSVCESIRLPRCQLVQMAAAAAWPVIPAAGRQVFIHVFRRVTDCPVCITRDSENGLHRTATSVRIADDPPGAAVSRS